MVWVCTRSSNWWNSAFPAPVLPGKSLPCKHRLYSGLANTDSVPQNQFAARCDNMALTAAHRMQCRNPASAAAFVWYAVGAAAILCLLYPVQIPSMPAASVLVQSSPAAGAASRVLFASLHGSGTGLPRVARRSAYRRTINKAARKLPQFHLLVSSHHLLLQ